MTEPQLPPGMMAGREIVRITTLQKENGDPAGISVMSSAPRDVLIAVLELALIQIKQLAPDVHGSVTVHCNVAPGGEATKRMWN